MSSDNRKVRDLLRYVADEDIGPLLRKRGDAICSVATSVGKQPRSENTVALKSLVERAGFELSRLSHSPLDVENAARAVRNCLESNILARYILLDPKHLKNWLLLRVQEERDILESLRKVYGPNATPEQLDALNSRIDHIISVQLKHGSKPTRLPKWSELAKRVNMADEYAGMYGLYSKYIHPSPWLLLKYDAGWSSKFCQVFLVHVQMYSCDLAMRALQALNLDTSAFGKAFNS